MAEEPYETIPSEERDEAKTRVFWNIDHFPIPEGLNPGEYFERIRSCLAKAGFNGQVSIWAYCQKKIDDALFWSYSRAGILLKSNEKVSGVQFAKVDNMLVDILLWPLRDLEEPLNFFIISKNISEGTELFGVLQDLDSEKENYKIFVTEEATSADQLCFSTIPFIGRNAVDRSGSSDEAKTGVFWNVGDCPIPEGLDLNKIYENVKSALSNQGCYGFSMWGYCEKNDLSLPGVTMVPAGDESSRFKKMLRDLLFWALRNPVVRNPKRVPTLMVISRSSGVDVLYRLISRGYNVLLALPDAVEYVSSFWLYPSLTGRGYPVMDQTLTGSGNPIIDQSGSSHCDQTLTGRGYPVIDQTLTGSGNPVIDQTLTGSGNPVIDQTLTGSGNPIIDQSESSHCVLNKGKKRARSGRRRMLALHPELIATRLLGGIVNMRKKIQKQSKSERKKLRRRLPKKATKANCETKTGVFWSIDPDCLALDRVDKKIKSALQKQGYDGDMSIKGYWDHRRGSCYGFDVFIPLYIRVSEDENLSVEVDNMFLGIVLWALENPAPSNLMVISENISEETEEVLGLLHALKQRGYNVLLPTAKTILCGEEPIFQDLPNLGKTLYSKSHEATTAVFWNIEDCPIPGGLDPPTFLENIKTVLANHGDVSITAYLDKNKSIDHLSQNISLGNITLVHAGDEYTARIKKMLKDILFWALENPKTSSVMVISNSIPDNIYEAFEALKSRGYNFLFANPNDVQYANSVWLSRSLFGGEKPIDRSGSL